MPSVVDPEPAGRLTPLSEMLAASHQVPPHRLAALIDVTCRRIGATSSRVWLADHEQRTLVHLTDGEEEARLPIDGSLAGRAFASEARLASTHDDGSQHVFAPLVDGVSRVGILEVELPTGLDGSIAQDLQDLAAIAAAELVTRGQYTDLFTVTRRRQEMSLAAELQWQALPPNSFSTSEVTVAGVLEPAYRASGDTFDYTQDDEGLSFAIMDAVGHDLSSTLISTLALGAYRNRRRAGDGLGEIADVLDEVIVSQFGEGCYATGQLAHLDEATGILHWLNAGHPLPLLVRDGHAVKELPCQPRPPFGLGAFAPGPPEIAAFQLQPGDALLLYTDGIVEARRADGVDFGLERLEHFLVRAFADQLSLAETLRRLTHAVLDYHGGSLGDDATTMLVSWHPTRTE
jgi:hypothetical protein